MDYRSSNHFPTLAPASPPVFVSRRLRFRNGERLSVLSSPNGLPVHEAKRLEAERENWSSDERMASVNDEPIQAVREVIALCAQTLQQRSQRNSEAVS